MPPRGARREVVAPVESGERVCGTATPCFHVRWSARRIRSAVTFLESLDCPPNSLHQRKNELDLLTPLQEPEVAGVRRGVGASHNSVLFGGIPPGNTLPDCSLDCFTRWRFEFRYCAPVARLWHEQPKADVDACVLQQQEKIGANGTCQLAGSSQEGRRSG